MSKGKIYRVQFRRRRNNVTDYRKRLKLLRSGRSRAVIRKSSSQITVQIVDYAHKGDIVRVQAISKELVKLGWAHSIKCLPAAYLTGYMAGKRAVKKGVSDAILDIGLQTPSKGARVFGVLKGLLDAGLDIPYDKSVLPGKDRIEGKHLNETMKKNIEEMKQKLE